MKKLIVSSFATVLTSGFLLSACGSNNNNNNPNNGPTADQVRSSANLVCTRQANGNAIAYLFSQNYKGAAADDLSTAFKTCGGQLACLDKSTGDMVRMVFAYETSNEKDQTKSNQLLAAYDQCADTDNYCLAKGSGDMLRYQLDSQDGQNADALKSQYDSCGGKSACLDQSVAAMEKSELSKKTKSRRASDLTAAYAKCGQ